MGPPDFKKMNKLEFGKKSRVFKHWVGELGDLLRDYFWFVLSFSFFCCGVVLNPRGGGNRIFCHQQNQIWNYEKLDGKLIGRPKVPSGMTGGVESEAMAYAVRIPIFSLFCSRMLMQLRTGLPFQTNQHLSLHLSFIQNHFRIPFCSLHLRLRASNHGLFSSPPAPSSPC